MKISISHGEQQIEQWRRPGDEWLGFGPEIQQACRETNCEIAEERENNPSAYFGISSVSAEPRQERVTKDRCSPHATVSVSNGIEVLAIKRTDRAGRKHEAKAEDGRNERIDDEKMFESHSIPQEGLCQESLRSGSLAIARRVCTVLQLRVVARTFKYFSKKPLLNRVFPKPFRQCR